MKHWIKVLLPLLLLTACSDSDPVGPATDYREGLHYQSYTRLDAVAAKPSATEFFTYGCSHCRAFAPTYADWLQSQSLAADYRPIIWNELTELHAKVFYLIKDRPDFKALHAQMFEFIGALPRTSGLGEQKVELIKKLNELGVSPMDAADAIDGERYTPQLAELLLVIKHYEVKSTPTVIVNGEHKILNKEMKDYQDILAAADYLLQQ